METAPKPVAVQELARLSGTGESMEGYCLYCTLQEKHRRSGYRRPGPGPGLQLRYL